MKEQLISFETAKLAKERGFNIPIQYVVNNVYQVYNINNNTISIHSNAVDNWNNFDSVYSAPTQSLLQKWLREVHNLHLYIDTTPSFEQMESHKSKYKVSVKVPFKPFRWTTGHYYLGNTYEEVLEKGLQEALKLIE